MNARGVRIRTWGLSLGALALIWGIALPMIAWLNGERIDGRDVIEFAQTHELHAQMSEAERAEVIDELTALFNQLNLGQRQKPGVYEAATALFDQMNETEQRAFVQATLPPGLRELLQSFDAQPDEQRQAALEAMRSDLERQVGGGSAGLLAEAAIQAAMTRIENDGLEAMLDSADPRLVWRMMPRWTEDQLAHRQMNPHAPFRQDNNAGGSP